MYNKGGEQEFEILGFRVRYKSDSSNQVSAGDVIESVLKEANSIKNRNINLDDKDVAILTALKIASDKLNIEKEYKRNVSDLQTKANYALNIIESISPSKS